MFSVNFTICLMHIIKILLQFPITALREIKILQLLKHENVVNLIEICRTRGKYISYSLSSIFIILSKCMEITFTFLFE